MISKAAIRISLIALDGLMEREESTTNRLRVHNAMCELTHELIERHTVETTAPAGTGPFTVQELFPPALTPGKVTYVITCCECGCTVQNSHEPVQKHVEWHNKVADL